MVLQCAGKLTTPLESGPVTTDLTTTVIHSYKLLINDVKTRSLTHFFTVNKQVHFDILKLVQGGFIYMYTEELQKLLNNKLVNKVVSKT